VEVSTELLAELGEWSEPVRVRVTDLRPDGRVEMVLQRAEPELAQARARITELERLRAWKAEAIEVLNGWEHAWEAAGQPGALGSSKALAVATALEQMKADLAEALQLLNHLATWCPCDATGESCANTEGHALLVRHGIRKAAP
jgi:hypothetical protein